MEKAYDINSTEQYYFSSVSGLQILKEGENKQGELETHVKALANFIPLLMNPVNMYEKGECKKYVEVNLVFKGDAKERVVTLPLNGLEKTDWSNDIDPGCLLNPEVRSAKEHIANLIRMQYAASDMSPERITIVEQIGGHIIDGIAAFHAGDQMIWPANLAEDERPQVLFYPALDKRLVVDSDCSEKDACAGMMRIVNLTPDAGRGIFSLNLMCIQWLAFEAAGIPPRCNLFLHGTTGAKKTTYASFTTQLYNRDKPLESPDRLNASIPATIKLMQKVRHGVLVLDDLYPADSAKMRHQQEETLMEVVRVIGDGTEPARVRNGEVTKNPPRCGILGTGEYYVGGGSDAARLFPLEIKTPIDCEKLTACQAEPLMLSTFYRYYISWYVTNFDEIVSLLKTWKAAFLERDHITGIHDRLQQTAFCLESAYRLFLTYCQDKGFAPPKTIQGENDSFCKQLTEIMVEQHDRSKTRKDDAPKGQVNYLSLISSIYHAKKLKLADKPDHFCRTIHDGVIHKNALYLREDKLMEKIRFYKPDAEFKEVIVDLQYRRALVPGKHNNSQQLNGTGGLRFYVVKLYKLR